MTRRMNRSGAGKSFRVSCDIGGTFTDLLAMDGESRTTVAKVPTTPHDPSVGFLKGLERLATDLGLTFREFLSRTELIIHGTTVATNAVIMRSGAKVGLLTTMGFRDILDQRRAYKGNIYDPSYPPPPEQWTLVPRHLRVGVKERVRSDGTVHTPLDLESLRAALDLLRNQKVESIAVCYLHSYIYPGHELETEEFIKNEYPNLHVSISFRILPVIGDYVRTSTVVLNSYVAPLLKMYLSRLSKTLAENGYSHPLLLATADGGVVTGEVAVNKAITIINSGPAAEPTSAILYSKLTGLEDVMTIDMGGTTFDVSLIKDGVIPISREGEIDRFRYGTPVVDVNIVGAGGGSLAWIDKGGLLRVGPRSAGADPGPASYGKGGEEPTVTDADLILGYLDPDYFLGGELKLSKDMAKKAIQDKIATPLGMSISKAAVSIHDIVNHKMVDSVRMVSVRRGEDPRTYSLIVAGGAGPVHAARIAMELDIPKILIPKISSVYSALGMLSTDLRVELTRTFYSRMRLVDKDGMSNLLKEIKERAIKSLTNQGAGLKQMKFGYYADVRYVGQIHEVEVPLTTRIITGKVLESMVKNFHKLHRTMYSYSEEDSETEVVNVRVIASASLQKPLFRPQEVRGKDPSGALKNHRDVYFEENNGFKPVPIYLGSLLSPGNSVEGPTVVEESTTTIVVPPDCKAQVDRYGNYLLSIKGRKK